MVVPPPIPIPIFCELLQRALQPIGTATFWAGEPPVQVSSGRTQSLTVIYEYELAIPFLSNQKKVE